MFKVNDYVVYGSNGVCKVTKIGTLNIGGVDKGKLYYTLKPVYSKVSTLYVPIDNTKVMMRKIITKEEASKLIDEIPEIETLWIENDKHREEIYKEAMKKCECREWIKIIKTLYIRKQKSIFTGRKFTNSDQKYLNMAEEGLYGELAISLEMRKENMENYITERVNV